VLCVVCGIALAVIGPTPVHWALQLGWFELAAKLTKLSAPILPRAVLEWRLPLDGSTVVHMACSHGAAEALNEMLLSGT